ncbi:MAG: alpha/beta hydrolase [Marmoricola sp.]
MRQLLWSPGQPPADETYAVALYLHGGAVRSSRPVTRAATTLQRMRWMRDALAPSLATDGIASGLLRYTVRGWNAKDGEPAPLADARWALEEVRERYGVPVILIGHSMGGRTGLRVAGHPSVVGLVGLAPWFPADEDVSPIRDRHLAVIHGTRDRITSARESRIVVERAEPIARSATYLPLPGLGHYLLNDATAWHRAARTAIRTMAEATRPVA